ncbi:hypothetical protein [Catellatospora chokoriensis]|uniref:Uncharacterized protein n=1 Tax=Catellatospora chokoriensis TaxID=310353 RepID=A0A8J3NSE3_9ACTN|nr:hypothetical protein [Catellatospora chokoriensis]GIF89150.1 hypothetical protein Cch02nite_25940 [Catellatospora chokoriensis]
MCRNFPYEVKAALKRRAGSGHWASALCLRPRQARARPGSQQRCLESSGQIDFAEGEELPQVSALIKAADNRLADVAAMASDDAHQSVPEVIKLRMTAQRGKMIFCRQGDHNDEDHLLFDFMIISSHVRRTN